MADAPGPAGTVAAAASLAARAAALAYVCAAGWLDHAGATAQDLLGGAACKLLLLAALLALCAAPGVDARLAVAGAAAFATFLLHVNLAHWAHLSP